MKHNEFVNSFSESMGIPAYDARKIVNAVFRHLQEELLAGNEIKLGRIGKFYFKFKEPMEVVDNIRGVRKEIGKRALLKFRSFRWIQNELNSMVRGE